jgi:hypothetical protein
MDGSSSCYALRHSALQDLVVSVLQTTRALGGEDNTLLRRGVWRDVLLLVHRIQVVYGPFSVRGGVAMSSGLRLVGGGCGTGLCAGINGTAGGFGCRVTTPMRSG